ncbi:uncharacterized protein BJX67DRAFT_19260 [Aspergillus lucknowensis]|uniref:Uncharacterized protein n=1 Tax=Aspergillus lucknowensis TaxID=176173 RepID=A0ABR4M875_9EURO
MHSGRATQSCAIIAGQASLTDPADASLFTTSVVMQIITHELSVLIHKRDTSSARMETEVSKKRCGGNHCLQAVHTCHAVTGVWTITPPWCLKNRAQLSIIRGSAKMWNSTQQGFAQPSPGVFENSVHNLSSNARLSLSFLSASPHLSAIGGREN